MKTVKVNIKKHEEEKSISGVGSSDIHLRVCDSLFLNVSSL